MNDELGFRDVQKMEFTSQQASNKLFGHDFMNFNNQLMYKQIIKRYAVIYTKLLNSPNYIDITEVMSIIHHLAKSLSKFAKKTILETSYMKLIDDNLMFLNVIIEVFNEDAKLR